MVAGLVVVQGIAADRNISNASLVKLLRGGLRFEWSVTAERHRLRHAQTMPENHQDQRLVPLAVAPWIPGGIEQRQNIRIGKVFARPAVAVWAAAGAGSRGYDPRFQASLPGLIAIRERRAHSAVPGEISYSYS